ncbi:hypothetical protein NM688_g1536 [Phlebia brevispora]|uniref:Uncharacterized protein n=1 Tax=Phlebia brevispora TaxID=194682 RepID=A0ACC1TB61_9APHY|nr:hypothetical protein NM688_g1536 [Phlebia brevispora]
MAKLKAAAKAKGQTHLDTFFKLPAGSSKAASRKSDKAATTKKVVKKRVHHDDDMQEDSAVDNMDEEDANDAVEDDGSDYEAPQTDEGSEEDTADEGEVQVEDEIIAEDDDDGDEVLDIEPVKQSKKKKAAGKGKSDVDVSSLPPIHEIPAIFRDLVARAPEMGKVAEHLKGRKMRVATMCSGTESPLLALELIRRSIVGLYNINLEFEHVFSCEIEPFKQAYIERNFSPPLLFRDVCELGDGYAHTAYGALAPVPGDVDLLVAGTSCVDYSNLNNEKKGIEANGESGRTFRGMMGWVKLHRPPLVILENVCGAPWDKVQKYFEGIDYSAKFFRVDTKKFYIPHTRTRVYLLAVDARRSPVPEQWKDLVDRLQRPASSFLDAFLLPSDDPRIHQGRERLAKEGFNSADRRTGRTDWTRCESRHQRARLEEELGSKRPLTGWEDGGHCKLADYAWNDWGVGQVERVWDLMDILDLRSAKLGVDPSYKTIVWNLSQNVDRNVGTTKLGTCPCLTPTMIPYITNRGGPMIGLEALSMQGLPVDELLLTRETEDQLADLAGNAMSTTVVGACIMAALIVGRKFLKAGTDSESYEEKNKSKGTEEQLVDEDAMDVDHVDPRTSTENQVSGEDQLQEKPLDLSATAISSLENLLADAMKSARLCQCEGRKDMTDRVLNRCRDCGSSSCVKCGGRPEHNTVQIDLVAHPRLSPLKFARTLKSVLPMALQLTNITSDLLTELKKSSKADIPDKLWAAWLEAVVKTGTEELRFVEPKRQEIWVVVYQSSTAKLELLLHPQRTEWRLFAKPEETEPANAKIRKILEAPVGRLVCDGGLFTGRFEFALPQPIEVSLTIEGSDPVPSWEARLGLQAEEFRDKKVHSRLEIKIPDADIAKFDRDISGVYVLLDKCGTANSALHKRIATPADAHQPPVFMLLDPTRCGPSEEDAFTFSTSIRRYEYGETRPVICSLDPKWRQSDVEGTQDVTCRIPCKWTASPEVSLTAAANRKATFSVPEKSLVINTSNDSCQSANAILVCRVPLNEQAGLEWGIDAWKEVDKVHERSVFKSLAWLTERWMRDKKKKVVAIEDSAQAGKFERALKRRPTPFVAQLKVQDGVGDVRIGVNVASLMHRALSRLPSAGRNEVATVSWRLNTDFAPMAKLNLPKFTLASNRSDPEHAQPPSFRIGLRPEQLRSLTWMVKQEANDAPPFVEEEISEAILEPLGWRVEGRAQRPIHVRGGVLADQVGYGKTAITLGLIDCTAREIEKRFSKMQEMDGKIPVKATLVIVPPHLTRQWGSEVKKFVGPSRFKTVILSSASNINALTIEEVQEADIVIVASNLFKSPVYLQNLSAFAAGGNLPENQEGRYFNARLESVLAALRSQVDTLREEQGTQQVLQRIREAGKKSEDDDVEFVQSKRLKGKRYVESVDQPKASKTPAEDKKPKVSSPPQSPKAVPRKGLVMEVVIPSSSKGNQTTSEKPKSTKEQRRVTKSKKLVVSDDDEGAESGSSSFVPSRASTEDLITPSDNDISNAIGAMDVDDTDDDVTRKPKKATTKGKAKSKSSHSTATSDSEATDAMDVDEPKGKKKATKKRKTSDDSDDDAKAKRPAKKARREDSDPWKLGTPGVRRDWTQMKAPPLEMFYFARTVVDEYTYLEGKVHSMVTHLTAERQWVLSGTPPLSDFGALKTIAAFLNVHLGIDDDGEGDSAKKRRREQTDAEKFHSFREVHSLEWHAHRHELGQAFLDRYVRQNIAEIDEIPCTFHVEKVYLPAAERAIYLELEHYLRALDMTVKKSKKSESDREKRLAQALGESASAEEALLKRCSHFDLETNNEENAMRACEVIVRERNKQLEECKKELSKQLREARKQEQAIGHTNEESLFQEYVRVTCTEGVGDEDATKMITALFADAGIREPLATITNQANQAKAKGKGKGKEDHLTAKQLEARWEHREKAHEIRRITKELVGRVRSLRYFTVVRDLQKQNEVPPVINCPSCGREAIPIGEIAVLSSCGHTGCYKCVMHCAEREECVLAAQGVCKAAARVLNVVEGKTLGVDDVVRDGQGRHFGKKLELVIDLIKKRIGKDERMLIFVQFPDLMKKVAEALDANDVKFLEIKGSASQKSKNLEKYQENSKERVLLLNVMDESASGANLTGANHAVFLSPLLAPSQEIYEACETQAVGRLRRYGQQKHVKIWRFLSVNTIDVQIYEERSRTKI